MWNGDTNRSSPAGIRQARDGAHDVQWTSVLRRPKQSGDTNRSSPAGLV